jgi:hypothetical protein
MGQIPLPNLSFDAHDRPGTIVHTPAPTLAQTFDRLGRVLTRSLSVGGTEMMTYSAPGPELGLGTPISP